MYEYYSKYIVGQKKLDSCEDETKIKTLWISQCPGHASYQCAHYLYKMVKTHRHSQNLRLFRCQLEAGKVLSQGCELPIHRSKQYCRLYI